MHVRLSSWALLPMALALTIAGCTNPAEVDSISVTPTPASINTGETLQLTATGTYDHAAPHPPTTQDVTDQSAWSSSAPAIATVSSSGLVTAVAAGTAIITASIDGFTGMLTSSATVVVTNPAGTNTTTTGSATGLVSLEIIPSAITVGNLQDTGNFLAIATFSSEPTIRDVTNSVTWISSAPNVFPVVTSNDSGANSGIPAGTVTAYGVGNANIIAEYTDPTSGDFALAQATFSCPVPTSPDGPPGTCFPGSQADALLSTITVYNMGLNTTSWQVTAPSATGTANVIHCGPGWTGGGGSVCVATYPPAGETIILEAQGGNFGGWSASCTPSTANGAPIPLSEETQTGPNYCTVTFSAPTANEPLNSNVTVGAIFN